MDEMTYFKKKLPSPDVILEVDSQTSVTDLTQMEIATYKMIDGVKTLKELSRLNRLGLFETTKIVFNLIQGGYVRIKSMSSFLEVSTESLEGTRKMIAAYNKVFEYIGKKSQNSAEKLRKDLATFLRKFEGDLATAFNGVEFGENLTLDADRITTNADTLESKGKMFSLLYKAFDEIYYFLLFSSGVTIEPKIETELNNLVEKISKNL